MRLAALALAAATTCAQAMEFRVAGNELHLRGEIYNYDLGTFRHVMTANPQIDTIVLGNSPGGDGVAGLRIGERIRDAGLRTVVAGMCYSACALVFLGGRSRHFAVASRGTFVYLAFHGAFEQDVFDPDKPSVHGRAEERAWILSRTAGRIDAQLLDAFLNTGRRDALLFVYDPRNFRYDYGFSLYFCDGTQGAHALAFRDCARVAGQDAFSLGLVNSEERVRVKPSRVLPPPYDPRKKL